MHALLAQIASPVNTSVGNSERINKLTDLFSNLLLFIPREGCKRVKFRPNQEWNCGLRKNDMSFMHETSFKRHKAPALLLTRSRDMAQQKGRHPPTHLVKPPGLSIPLFHRVQGRLSRKVEHEEYGNGVIANKREHVHKFALASKVPDGECDCCPSYGYCLLHEINACRDLVER